MRGEGGGDVLKKKEFLKAYINPRFSSSTKKLHFILAVTEYNYIRCTLVIILLFEPKITGKLNLH